MTLMLVVAMDSVGVHGFTCEWFLTAHPATNCAQISIFAGRGILIESQGPTWLYGTAAEHSVLYQVSVTT